MTSVELGYATRVQGVTIESIVSRVLTHLHLPELPKAIVRSPKRIAGALGARAGQPGQAHGLSYSLI